MQEIIAVVFLIAFLASGSNVPVCADPKSDEVAAGVAREEARWLAERYVEFERRRSEFEAIEETGKEGDLRLVRLLVLLAQAKEAVDSREVAVHRGLYERALRIHAEAFAAGGTAVVEIRETRSSEEFTVPILVHDAAADFETRHGRLRAAEAHLDLSIAIALESAEIDFQIPSSCFENAVRFCLAKTPDRPGRASDLLKRWLAEGEKRLGKTGEPLVELLRKIAHFYERLPGEEAKGLALLERAIRDDEKRLGAGNLDLVSELLRMAELRAKQGDLGGADETLRRALDIHEREVGPETIGVTAALVPLARVHDRMGLVRDAEAEYERALAIADRSYEGGFGTYHWELWPEVAAFHERQGRLDRAEPLRKKLFESYENAGPHRLWRQTGASYAELLRKLGRAPEAAAIEARLAADPKNR